MIESFFDLRCDARKISRSTTLTDFMNEPLLAEMLHGSIEGASRYVEFSCKNGEALAWMTTNQLK